MAGTLLQFRVPRPFGQDADDFLPVELDIAHERNIGFAEPLFGNQLMQDIVGMEDRLGRLAPGYYADLIVVEKDPFACPPDELLSLGPSATMLAGEWLWQGLS